MNSDTNGDLIEDQAPRRANEDQISLKSSRLVAMGAEGRILPLFGVPLRGHEGDFVAVVNAAAKDHLSSAVSIDQVQGLLQRLRLRLGLEGFRTAKPVSRRLSVGRGRGVGNKEPESRRRKCL